MIQSLSILPRPHESPTAAPPVSAASPKVDPQWELGQIAVEEVHILPESRIVVQADPRGLAADRFRYLRLRLRERAESGKLKTLLVTSPSPEDGKSTVALNLATTLAEGGKRNVLLLEGDLYHATIAQNLGLPVRPGLAECLESGLDPVSPLRRLEPLGFYFLSGGEAHGNPTELLHSDRLPEILRALTGHFDWVVMDSPPVTPITDALSLARHADAALLVTRAGRTSQESVTAACTLLGPKKIIGIILNGVEGLGRVYSKYYGRYGSKASTSTNGRKGAPE